MRAKVFGTVLLHATFFGISIAHASLLYTNIVSFASSNGAAPTGALIQDTDGTFYGATGNGGTNGGFGTIWRMTPDGSLTSLVSLTGTNGAFLGTGPKQLIKATDGNFYGTTFSGGAPDGTNSYGTIFRVSSNGDFTTLLSFTGTNPPYLGAGPNQLIQGSDGNLYGTTFSGGSPDHFVNHGIGYAFGFGTIFKASTNGTMTTLAVMSGTTGAFPGANSLGGLIQTSDGSLYGTTENGGTNGNFGTVFGVTTNGSLLWSFSFAKTNGAGPQAGLVQASDGNLYGVTSTYSATPFGPPLGSTVFRITTNGEQTVFVQISGGIPNPVASLIQASDGNLYGTTLQGSSDGTIFSVTLSGTLSNLFTFTGSANDGAFPQSSLLQASDNTFYGTILFGGALGNGAVYRLSIGLPAFLQTPVVASNGTVSLTWSAALGQTYLLQYSTNLNSTNWIGLKPTIRATNGTITKSDPSPADSQRFYRVFTLP
jgi:uncharacterized repeat protein (TIGR03803 family)